jgi:hypothetical protein
VQPDAELMAGVLVQARYTKACRVSLKALPLAMMPKRSFGPAITL